MKVKIFHNYHYEPVGFLDRNQKPVDGKVKVKWQDGTEAYYDAKKIVIVQEPVVDMPEQEVSVWKEEKVDE